MRWVAGYETAWRDGDLEAVGDLFTADATYLRSPYEPPDVGIDAIRAFWLEDDDEVFTLVAEPVAVEGRTAVVRALVATATRSTGSTPTSGSCASPTTAGSSASRSGPSGRASPTAPPAEGRARRGSRPATAPLELATGRRHRPEDVTSAGPVLAPDPPGVGTAPGGGPRPMPEPTSPRPPPPAPGTAAAPRVTFVGHATVLLEVAGLRVLTDPVLADRVTFLRRVVPSVPAPVWADIDLVLVSHLHHDHLHLPSLRRLVPAPTVVVPRGAGRLLRRVGLVDVREVVAGDVVVVGGLTVTVVPADHDDRRTPLGTRAAPVGYLIEAEGWSAYMAGDTGLFDGMAELRGRVDVALLPVWGWGPTLGPGHLDPEGAAEAAARIEPAAVVPIHWGTLWPAGVRRAGGRGDRLVAPPREMAEALARRRLPVEVLHLAPGATTVASGPRWKS